MVEITKVYKQNIPATRFIGKKYSDADRVNGGFGAKWGEWFQNGWFDEIEKQVDGSSGDLFEDGGATIGLMGKENGEFRYWIGYFTPADTVAPSGFESIDFPACNIGIAWLYGKEEEIFGKEPMCAERLEKEGYEIIDFEGYNCFERYACRFASADEKGNLILDLGFFVK